MTNLRAFLIDFKKCKDTKNYQNFCTIRRKSVENLVISSQDAIGQSISQALTFSGVITQHANQIIQETR